jgi:formate dehydrogenase subunit gamma
LFTRGRDAQLQIGKFNPGQKLNAAFVAGAGLVMTGTGAMLKWFAPFPNSWRTGATFVHDWTALALGLAIIGHIWLAIADPDALRGIVRGSVPASWARKHRPRWHDEMVGAEPDAATKPRP